MIHVIDVQSRATMQDLGRFGLRRFGISHCGAMDKLALRAKPNSFAKSKGVFIFNKIRGRLKHALLNYSFCLSCSAVVLSSLSSAGSVLSSCGA